ncbi:MAG: hypothetical protein CMQ38_05790 [Gammaproteobacteria bacterium]|nr:hypothetical protein [Gammaproteobacteria bacterium]
MGRKTVTQVSTPTTTQNDTTVNNLNYQYDYAYDYDYELDQEYDIDQSRSYGDVEEDALAVMGNQGPVTINQVSDGAFPAIQSVALAAIDAAKTTTKDSLQQTVEGLSYINAGLAKSDKTVQNVEKGLYIVGGLGGLALLVRAFK